MFLLRRKRLEQYDALESHQARLSAEGTKFGVRGGEPNKVVGLWHFCTQGQAHLQQTTLQSRRSSGKDFHGNPLSS